MAAKLTRLTHKIQLHLVVQSYTICSSRFRRSVRKLLDTPSYVYRDQTKQISWPNERTMDANTRTTTER